MNFFTLLKQEHKEAKDTFKALLEAEEIDHKEAELLCNKLLLHMEMEEKYFYPLIQKAKDDKAVELSEEAQLEHTEAKKPIKELLSGKLDNVEFKVKLELLQLEITHHAEEEEKELFPKAKEILSAEQVTDITEKMVALKEKKLATIAK
jgi:iron-sulfur cluster repair protein YtfE (RIC family)